MILLGTTPLVAVQTYNEWTLRAERERELRARAMADASMLSHELARLVSGVELLLASISHRPIPVDRLDECNDYMAHLTESFPLASNIGIADANGRVLCLNTPFERGRLHNNDRLYFRRAIETRHFSVGEYMTGRATGRRVLAFATPILGKDGHAIEGVAYASINLDALARELLKRPLPPDASLTIVDAEGTVLVRWPESDRVGERLPDAWMKVPGSDRPRIDEGAAMFGSTSRVVASVPLALPPHGLFVSVGLDRQQSMRAVNASTARSLVTMALAVLLSVILTVLLGRYSIRQPLERLMTAARSWKNGDLSARTRLKSRDTEFIQIGQIFDEMAEALDMHQRRRDAIERALRQSRDEAMRASASKTEFLASASHDLRQPLQAMSMTVALLAARRGGEDAAEIALLKRAVDNLSAMVEGMMDVAQLDAGLIMPKRAAVDLGSLLRAVEGEFAAAAQQQGLGLRMQACAACVWSDPVLLGRIIRNLVSNALKFTPRGGAIDVLCEEENHTVSISVRDTGIGIPLDKQERIFDEFHQIDNPERDRRKGLGLGLSIVKKLSALLDHRVSVQSEPGKGSTFTVFVPRASPGTSARVPEPVVSIALPRSVLLVEDDELVAESTTELLESWGATVTHARTAEDAFRLFEQPNADIDIAIVDYRLPDSSGLEVIARARSRWPALVAILLTGDASTALAARAEENRIEILRKPVRVERLATLLSGLA
ncbi:MAG TPA: ATP-binding protein [Burkholderiales bacterium]